MRTRAFTEGNDLPEQVNLQQIHKLKTLDNNVTYYYKFVCLQFQMI